MLAYDPARVLEPFSISVRGLTFRLYCLVFSAEDFFIRYAAQVSRKRDVRTGWYLGATGDESHAAYDLKPWVELDLPSVGEQRMRLPTLQADLWASDLQDSLAPFALRIDAIARLPIPDSRHAAWLEFKRELGF